jgi:glycosyltransferase involved in cell wall biosynthesis
MKISLLTGGGEKHYQLGLISGLIAADIDVEFIGNDEISNSDLLNHSNVTFYNLRGNQNHYAPIKEKVARILRYYYKLIKYAVQTDSKIFHIQWLNKFYFFDRTILMLLYKLLGKKIVFTAHNINAKKRENRDNFINRLSLKIHYALCDSIIVHTKIMKDELINDFNTDPDKIYVICHGLNSTAPIRGVTQSEARNHLGVTQHCKCILFFGCIDYYKGLDVLCKAFYKLSYKCKDYFLIIAGRDKDCPEYVKESIGYIDKPDLSGQWLLKNDFIPDDDLECYFSAADCIVLPYRKIYQSGVIFLAYRFGLPIIATDVGSFKEDIIQGETGFICKNNSDEGLSETINDYFNNELYLNLKNNRGIIKRIANEKYSWEKIGFKTYNVYKNIE